MWAAACRREHTEGHWQGAVGAQAPPQCVARRQSTARGEDGSGQPQTRWSPAVTAWPTMGDCDAGVEPPRQQQDAAFEGLGEPQGVHRAREG